MRGVVEGFECCFCRFLIETMLKMTRKKKSSWLWLEDTETDVGLLFKTGTYFSTTFMVFFFRYDEILGQIFLKCWWTNSRKET